jgi:hypothetical protein
MVGRRRLNGLGLPKTIVSYGLSLVVREDRGAPFRKMSETSRSGNKRDASIVEN